MSDGNLTDFLNFFIVFFKVFYFCFFKATVKQRPSPLRARSTSTLSHILLLFAFLSILISYHSSYLFNPYLFVSLITLISSLIFHHFRYVLTISLSLITHYLVYKSELLSLLPQSLNGVSCNLQRNFQGRRIVCC